METKSFLMLNDIFHGIYNDMHALMYKGYLVNGLTTCKKKVTHKNLGYLYG